MGVPLCPELSAYVRRDYLSKSIRALPRADAPRTFTRLREQAYHDSLGRWVIPVWNGASGSTIHASPTENYVFRAWHDASHLTHGYGFSPAEEEALALIELRRARAAGLSQWALSVLWAELAGQVQYLVRHGAFPTDQRAFVEAYASRVEPGGNLPLHMGRY